MTHEEIIACLEDAGRTLLALRLPAAGPAGARSGWPEVVHELAEAYGYGEAEMRVAVPSARAVTRMDEVLGWIRLIPTGRYVLRRIVGARALVSPRNDRHLFSWRRLGRVLHADHCAVKRWHSEGIGIIAISLANRANLGDDPGYTGAGCMRHTRVGA